MNVQSDQLAEKDATPFVEQVKKEKIAQILTDKIDKMKDDDTIVVAIWVGTDDGAVVDKAAGGNIAQAETDAKANIASKVKPFVDSLKAKKVEIVYQSIYAPLVFAKVTKAQVKDLALQSDVGYVTVDNTMEKNTNTAIPTVLLPPVWATPVDQRLGWFPCNSMCRSNCEHKYALSWDAVEQSCGIKCERL
ncbi:MAG: hypothetical protein NTW33_02795 [Methanoregula sp.]|nr:hypothetical protein [Methanoregula sp.]